MSASISAYLAACEEIVKAKPKYEKGASTLKECDCIGMSKYAFRVCGVKFSSTGTNNSARYQMARFELLTDVAQLVPGAVVFRAKSPGESGYNLPGAYQKGGSKYNGDLTDYTHIGTVVTADPVRIVHMTSPTAKVDTNINRWSYIGEWLPEYVDYSGVQPDTPADGARLAVVVASAGSTVNLRKAASTSSSIVTRVPVGASVYVDGVSGDWAQIKYGAQSGYIMARYLSLPDAVPILYTVTVPALTKDQADRLASQYPGAVVSGGKGV